MALEIKKKGRRIIVKGTTSTSVEITDKPVTIRSINWVKPTNIAHLAGVTDSDGDPIAEFYAVVAYQSQHIDDIGPVDNIWVDDLDSGYFVIHLEGIGV